MKNYILIKGAFLLRKIKGNKKTQNSEQHNSMSVEEREKMMTYAVEQQIESEETRFVKETYERLLKAGLNEKDAKTKIVEKFIEEMYFVLQKHQEFDINRYRKSLDNIQ